VLGSGVRGIPMSAHLNLANKLLREMRANPNRELKYQFKDLWRVVEHLTTHLNDLSGQKKAAKGEVV
jgi:hypothetical protein